MPDVIQMNFQDTDSMQLLFDLLYVPQMPTDHLKQRQAMKHDKHSNWGKLIITEKRAPFVPKITCNQQQPFRP